MSELLSLLISMDILNKNNSFIYGNAYNRSSERKDFWQVRFLSKILNKIAPMFSYDSCAFTNLKVKSTTARAVIGKDIGILNCFTLESSFHAFRYFSMQHRCFIIWKYTIDDYHAMGDFLWKGVYGTVKAFFDHIDGILYNPNASKNNQELANNSITVNALARKAHQEILEAKELPVKKAIRRVSKQTTAEKTLPSKQESIVEDQEGKTWDYSIIYVDCFKTNHL